jgi:hypothetical protein
MPFKDPEKRREYNRIQRAQWRATNPEVARAEYHAWREKNQEKAREASRQWRLANPDKVREQEKKRPRRTCTPEQNRVRVKKYAAAYNTRTAKRRAAKLQATPPWANAFFIAEAYRLAKLREKVCGGSWHVDHVVPLQSNVVCGLHVEHNLQVIPGRENLSKGNQLPVRTQ